MFHRYLLILSIGLATMLGCTVFEESKDSPRNASEGRSGDQNDATFLSGFGVDGEKKSCPEVTCSDDTSVSSPPAEFTALCAKQNSVVKTCSCGDYICVDPNDLPKPVDNKGKPGELDHTGYDIDGRHVSCTNSNQEIACTMIYGPEERFKDQCLAKGYEAFTCGCHDYLCSQPIE